MHKRKPYAFSSVPPSDGSDLGANPAGSGRKHGGNFPKPGIRQPFGSAIPNFRDEGMQVGRPLLVATLSLQRRYGWCFASEAEKRRMLGEDTGHGAGVGTISEREDALEVQGLLVIRRAMPGSTMPDGSECLHGTRLTRVLTDQRAQHAARQDYERRLLEETRRAPKKAETRRPRRPPRVLHEPQRYQAIDRLLAGVKRPANPSRPVPLSKDEARSLRADDFEAERQRQLMALAAMGDELEPLLREKKKPPDG